MDDSEQRNWQKRFQWAKCREPYKTQLDTLASHWLEGALSNEELALELWKFQVNRIGHEEDHEGTGKLNLKDVDADIQILANAVCDVSHCYDKATPATPDDRRISLNTCIQQERDPRGFNRGD